MPNFQTGEARERVVPPSSFLMSLLLVCKVSLVLSPCFPEIENKYKIWSRVLATEQMNACVWDNRLILAMGSIFETASMLGVNACACISLDELVC